MNCLSNNQIQAYLDGELSKSEGELLVYHLEQCLFCRESYENQRVDQEFCNLRIRNYNNLYATEKTEVPSLPLLLIGKYSKQNKGANQHMKTYKKYLLTACALVLVIGGMAMEPVRAAVGDVVSIFRAQNIKTMDISLGDLKTLEENIRHQEGNIDIENLAKVAQQGNEYKVISESEAQSSVDFPLTDLPGLKGKTLSEVNMMTAGKIDFTLNIANVNQLMKTLGAKKLFDMELDGKTFSINSAASVSMTYALDTQGSFNKHGINQVTYTQTKLPEITAPQGVSIQDLVDAIGSLSVLPSNLQSQLKSMTDVDKTLYLPNVDGTVESFDLGDQTFYGYFETGDYTYGSVMWMENDIVKALTGDFTKEDLEKIIKGNRQ